MYRPVAALSGSLSTACRLCFARATLRAPGTSIVSLLRTRRAGVDCSAGCVRPAVLLSCYPPCERARRSVVDVSCLSARALRSRFSSSLLRLSFLSLSLRPVAVPVESPLWSGAAARRVPVLLLSRSRLRVAVVAWTFLLKLPVDACGTCDPPPSSHLVVRMPACPRDSRAPCAPVACPLFHGCGVLTCLPSRTSGSLPGAVATSVACPARPAAGVRDVSLPRSRGRVSRAPLPVRPS